MIPKVQCISSNPGVATVEINEVGNNSFVFFHVDKPGTTTIFTTVEYNGETYDYVTKLVVVAWKNPVKTLKIGKKSFAKKFASNDTYYTGDVKKGKFKIIAAKGWKIKYIKFINGNKSKKIKNGSTINMKKAYMNAEIKVKLYNSKLKRTEYIYLKKAQVFG